MNSTLARLGATAAASLAVFAFATPAAQAAPPEPGTGNGANGPCAPYCANGDGETASMNGNGGGNATGRPPAGTVGNADNKFPPGQAPNGEEDGNSGYECDTNNGIGKTNPAHTGCSTSSQPS